MKFHYVPPMFRRRIVTPRLQPVPQTVLVLWGVAGTGKTHEACDLIYRGLEKKDYRDAEFHTVESMMDTVSMSLARGRTREEAIERLLTTGCLLIDDLGSSDRHWKEAKFDMLREVIVGRIDSGSKTIITTNCPLDHIAENAGDGLADRLINSERGACRAIEVKKKKLHDGNLGDEWKSKDEGWLGGAVAIFNQIRGYRLEQEIALIWPHTCLRHPILCINRNADAHAWLKARLTDFEMEYLREIEGHYLDGLSTPLHDRYSRRREESLAARKVMHYAPHKPAEGSLPANAS